MMLKFLFESKETVHKKTYYLADYPDCTTREWANMIQETIGAKVIKTVPHWFLVLIGKVGDIIKFLGVSNPPLTSFRLRNMRSGGIYPITEIKKLCGVLPYDLRTGVRLTSNWLYEINDIKHKPII